MGEEVLRARKLLLPPIAARPGPWDRRRPVSALCVHVRVPVRVRCPLCVPLAVGLCLPFPLGFCLSLYVPLSPWLSPAPSQPPPRLVPG